MGIRKLPAENGLRPHEQLFWSIRGIHTLLDAIHGTWADRLGVTTSQLLMVFALRDFDDQGAGLRVKEVATLLSVDARSAIVID